MKKMNELWLVAVWHQSFLCYRLYSTGLIWPFCENAAICVKRYLAYVCKDFVYFQQFEISGKRIWRMLHQQNRFVPYRWVEGHLGAVVCNVCSLGSFPNLTVSLIFSCLSQWDSKREYPTLQGKHMLPLLHLLSPSFKHTQVNTCRGKKATRSMHTTHIIVNAHRLILPLQTSSHLHRMD